MIKKIKINVWYWIAVSIFLILNLGPILWCFIISITPNSELFTSEQRILADNFTFENYINILDWSKKDGANFFKALVNSLKTTMLSVVIGMPIAIVAGFAFSRIEFKNKNLYLNSILTTMVIPVFATIIPLYLIFSKLGLLDDIFWLSIIYISAFLPVIIWLIKNYFKTFPKEVEDMALIDGCTRLQAFIYIILPNTYTIIIASFLMIFLMTWSQYQIPLILASTRETKPLSVLIAEYSKKDMILYGQMAAAGILAILVPLILSLFTKKYLVSDLTKGSIN